MKIEQIHHVAYRCKDAKQTVEWYNKMLKMDFVLAIAEDHVPSTHEPDPYMHIFMDAGNGNVLAFFELPTKPEMDRDRNTPVWVQHIAFKVKDRETLIEFKEHLEANGVEVLGVTDHSIFHSIYFFDPVNNIPLEASWALMEITDTPAIVDVETLAVAEEGAEPQPGHWPAVENPTPADQMIINHPGNAFTLRDELLRRGQARLTADGRKALEEMQEPVA